MDPWNEKRYEKAQRRELRLYCVLVDMERRNGGYLEWWYARREAGMPQEACTVRRWVGMQNKSFQRRYREIVRQQAQAGRLLY